MRKVAFSVVPVLALLAASPAFALTKGQANCPVELADRELSQALVSAMVDQKEGDPVDEDLLSGVMEVFKTCVEREKVPEAQRSDYLTYTTEAIAVAEQTRQLQAAGINPATIDKAFDIGPGGRNPDPEEFADEDFMALRNLLAKDGIRIETLPNRTIGLIGSYAALAGALWKVRERLD